MSDKHPLTTQALVHRLLRVAKALDTEAQVAAAKQEWRETARWRARANTCLQAAGRLLEKEP